MSMDVEVSVAWNFVISYLYNKLPRRRVDCFGEELERGLKQKFEGHWYPEMPFKGSAFRCVKVNGIAADPLVEQAAINSGINIEEVREYLPKELTLWIDPKEVSYRIGEKGLVKILYSDRKEEFPCEVIDCEIQNMNGGFNPDAQSFRPIETLSASMSSLNLSPADGSSPTSPWGSPSPTQVLQNSGTSPINTHNGFHPTPRGQQDQKFTAAMFAQTKFGSTKLKSNAKRPNRLSPTDFGSYMKQRSVLQSHWINGVGAVSPVGAAGYNALSGFPAPALAYPSQLQAPLNRGRPNLSPRDARQDFLTQQQRLMLVQHQGQFQQQQHSILQNGLLSPTSSTPGNHPNDPFPNLTPVAANNAVSFPASQGAGHPENNLLNMKSPASDLGLQGIMGRIATHGEESPNNQAKSGNSNDNANWGNLSSPYANLQHLLVAN